MGRVAQPSNEGLVASDSEAGATDSEAGPAFPTYLGMKPESPPRIRQHRYLKKAPPRGTTAALAAATQATTVPAAAAPEAVPNWQVPAVMEHRVVVKREVEDTPVASGRILKIAIDGLDMAKFTLPRNTDNSPVNGVADPHVSRVADRPLGCSGCRYAVGGCSRCRNPNFKRRSSNTSGKGKSIKVETNDAA